MNTTLFRIGMNLYPLYHCTGGKILHIADDWKKVTLQLSLNMWTKNYVGTIFGGSLFSASDPFCMIMLIHILGKKYVVWDKAASIKFKRPGKTKLLAHLEYSDEELHLIKEKVQREGEMEMTKKLEWKDPEGKVVAEVERLIYIATKDYYKAKRANKGQI